MRIAGRGIGHRIDVDRAGRRIEPPDRAVAVARVPDATVRVGGDAVRTRVRRETILAHLAGLRIEAAEQARVHPGPPDRAVGELQRIARTLAEPPRPATL